MSKFDKIIKRSVTQLEEGIQDANNPVIKQAVNAINTALNNSGQVQGNANARDLAKDLFGSSSKASTTGTTNTTPDNPLHSAFDKIKNNPENPDLQDHEKEAYLSFADKISPKQEEPEKKEDNESSSSSDENNSESEQPNATQYNPLNQPSA